MLKRFAFLLLSTMVALYAPPTAVVHALPAAGIEAGAIGFLGHASGSEDTAQPSLTRSSGSANASVPSAIDPARPASAVLAPIVRTQHTAVRDAARLASQPAPQSLHARSQRHRASLVAAPYTVARLDALWRIVPQRALAIPHDAIAPPPAR